MILQPDLGGRNLDFAVFDPGLQTLARVGHLRCDFADDFPDFFTISLVLFFVLAGIQVIVDLFGRGRAGHAGQFAAFGVD